MTSIMMLTINSESIKYFEQFWRFVYQRVAVMFVEKFNELNVGSPAQPHNLLEEIPGELDRDHRVTVSVNHDDRDLRCHHRQLLVRKKVNLRPGREQPGEEPARQECGPG